MHCIYVETNMYREPRGEIITLRVCEKYEFPNCNSDGEWGNEKDGIFRQWIDLNIKNRLKR